MNFPRLLPLLSLGFLFLTPFALASTTDGTIDATNRYAWSENAGWIDFGTTEGNVHVTDSALTGYAWGENVGWISLNCSNDSSCATVDYKVTNNNEGTLGGNAWSENLGWIQFAPTNGGVTISSSGIFSGYAWGENVGWIVFNCSNQSSCGTVDYKVSTDWRPASTRVTESSSSSSAPAQQSGGARASTRDRKIAEALRNAQPTSGSSSSVSSKEDTISASNPAVLLLTKIRERLLTRIEKRMETATSVSAKKMLEGIRERLLKRIDARIRSLSGIDQ